MEPVRQSPPITIEGGPGWAITPTPDVVTAGEQEQPRSGWRRAGALAAAAVVGAALATVVADERTTRLAETEAGALSLVVESDVPYRALVSTADGHPAVAVPLALRNTGPREIALQEVELLSTGLRAGEVDGQRLGRGKRYAVQLVRPVDCDQPPVPTLPGPLRVRATTDAGEREVELRVRGEGVDVADDVASAACGYLPPARALSLRGAQPTVDGDSVRVPFELGNASRDPLRVTGVQALSGLRVRALLTADGRPASLPLVLPPQDFDAPRDPSRPPPPQESVVVVLEVVDCGALRALLSLDGDRSSPLVEVEVAVEGGPAGGRTSIGDPAVLARLGEAVCAGRPDRRADQPPD